jgi:uncharacterized peroxidase-related enzyme
MRQPFKAAALAIAALPGLATAQSSVSIYGTLNADVESVEATGATVPSGDFSSRGRVSSNSSNVGFRGVEDLGGGLKVFFQVESSANLDEGGGTWASRNSAVGLTSAWGQILLGQWDTPYKVATARLDPFGTTGIAAYSGIMGFSGSLTAGQGGANFQQRASFDRRARNVVQYPYPYLRKVAAEFPARRETLCCGAVAPRGSIRIGHHRDLRSDDPPEAAVPLIRSLPENAALADLRSAHADLHERFRPYGDALMRGPSPFTPGERELIAAYVSGLNSCRYCFGVHSRVAAGFGIDESLFTALMQDLGAAPIDARLKPVLRYVRKLTETPARMTPADAAAVYDVGWDDTALVHAIAVCAYFNMMNRLVDGAGIVGDAEAYGRAATGLIEHGYRGPKGSTA